MRKLVRCKFFHHGNRILFCSAYYSHLAREYKLKKISSLSSCNCSVGLHIRPHELHRPATGRESPAQSEDC